MTSEPTPESDLEMLEAVRKLQTQSVSMEQWARSVHVAACSRLINFMGERLSRITIPITEHYDWHRLRVNVAHLVEPKLVKWSGK